MTKTTTETSAKQQLVQLQKAIVDGLEDVKAKSIQVFDTTTLSPLFERVIVASATSSRQTKALAASVRDKIKEAGLPKPRTEGEENGEWIIVDCGPAVVHIMQPSIREYYRLEEIWGETPVKIKAEVRRKSAKAAEDAVESPAANTNGEPAAKPARKRAPARKTTAKKETATEQTQDTAVKKAPARKRATTAASKTGTGASAKPTTSKVATKKVVTKKAITKAVDAKPAAAKKPAAKRASAKKAS